MPSNLDPAWEYYAPDPEFATDPDEFRADVVADFASKFSGVGCALRAKTTKAPMGECKNCTRVVMGTSDARRTYDFCSFRCMTEYRFKHSHRATLAPTTCEGCGVPITEPQNLQQGHRFCGLPCYWANRKAKSNPDLQRNCGHCGKPFTVRAKTVKQAACSRECGARLRWGHKPTI